MANHKRRGRPKKEELKTSVITVNDVLEELTNENKRLLNELMFANKCLNVLIQFKTFVDFISNNFKSNLHSNESQKFESLLKEVENVFSENKRHLKSIQNNDIKVDIKEESKPIVESKPSKNVYRYVDSYNGDTDEEEYKPKRKYRRRGRLRLNRITDESKPKKSFICHINGCGQQLRSKQGLQGHIRSHSRIKKVYKCDFDGCDYQTTGSKNFIFHTNRHKGVKPYKCDYESCGRAFITEQRLKYHIRCDHLNSEKRFKCPFIGCNYETDRKCRLKQHNLIHEGVDPFPYQCALCSRGFATPKGLEEHKQNFHLKRENEVVVNCPIHGCNALHGSDWTLQVHLQRHRRKMRELVEHKEFVCGELECNFSTDDSTELETHHKQHWFQYEYPCPVEGCAERLRRIWDLTFHIRAVHPEYKKREFKCHICEQTFKNRGRIDFHKIKEHSDILLRCEWPGCDYTSKHKTRIECHRIVHSTERNFLCEWPECHKRFKTKVQLEEHLRIHTNDKKYACSWPGCSYRCTNSGNLIKHKRVHIK